MRAKLGAALVVMLVLALGAPAGAGVARQPALEATGEGLSVESSATLGVDDDRLVSVLVDLVEEPLASYQGGLPGLAATSPAATGDDLDLEGDAAQAYLDHLDTRFARFASVLRAAVPEARVGERFDVVIGGVSARVPRGELQRIARLPGVRGVHLDTLEQPLTETTPAFMGADVLWERLGGQHSAGEGVVVGVLDSGVWPEHPSFADPDPSGKPYAAPPGTYGCSFGSASPGDAPFACNNKLVGSYRFMATYDAVVGLAPGEFASGRDDNGHGTHTATTAAGNGGVAASVLGIPRGTVSGIAPRAHVVSYKVCGDLGCYQTDTVAAVQQAILDGVDVVNFSISGGETPYSDMVSLAFLDAYAAGVLVSASAGNAGPGPETVAHREPWTMTVGASSSNRSYVSTVTLTAEGGATLELSGVSITAGITVPTPVVVAGGDGLCNPTMPPVTPAGAIVVCERATPRVGRSFNAMNAGAAGMIMRNAVFQGIATDTHYIPSVHLENAAGDALMAFLAANTGVTATFTPGTATAVPGDVMAYFSSRGGPEQSLGVSKPDVTAPGLQILAGQTPLAANGGPRGAGPHGELFQAIQGTSMSAPHGAGAAALIKAAHPTWTPGEIKSALMISAQSTGVRREDGTTPTTPFDAGSGSIRPARADQVPFVMDEDPAAFVTLRNRLWDANLPSIYVPTTASTVTVERTLRDARDGGPPNGVRTMRTQVDAPADVRVTAPAQVRLFRDQSTTIAITVDVRDVPVGEVRHATLTFTLGGDAWSMPITVVRREPAVDLAMDCDPTTVVTGTDTTCTLTMQNRADGPAAVSVVNELPNRLALVPGSATGGATEDGNTVRFAGTLPGRTPVTIGLQAGGVGAPFGLVPLAQFGISPIAMGDESLVNLTVPAFVSGGVTYDRIGLVSNGYAVLGGGTGADITFINQWLPDPVAPNNVLAPLWTDLNPAAGGAIRAGTLTDGVSNWIVLEWFAVPNWGDGRPNTFQIWLEIGTDAIGYAYGAVTGGDGGWGTIGAENAQGNRGAMAYFDGQGTIPPAGARITVLATPGSVPGPVSFSYRATAGRLGLWQNVASLSADVMPGTTVARVDGRNVKR